MKIIWRCSAFAEHNGATRITEPVEVWQYGCDGCNVRLDDEAIQAGWAIYPGSWSGDRPPDAFSLTGPPEFQAAPPPPRPITMTPTEVRARRAGLALSQDRLARALGVTGDSVRNWESGRRPVPPLLPLALEALEQRRERAAEKESR